MAINIAFNGHYREQITLKTDAIFHANDKHGLKRMAINVTVSTEMQKINDH